MTSYLTSQRRRVKTYRRRWRHARRDCLEGRGRGQAGTPVAWDGKSTSRCARPTAGPRSLDDYGWSRAGPVELARIAPFAACWSCQSFLELAALPSAVPCARLHARQVLWEWGLTAFSENSELAVSELVTNAVQVSRATVQYVPARIWVVSDRAQVVILVWDVSALPPVHARDAEVRALAAGPDR